MLTKPVCMMLSILLFIWTFINSLNPKIIKIVKIPNNVFIKDDKTGQLRANLSIQSLLHLLAIVLKYFNHASAI